MRGAGLSPRFGENVMIECWRRRSLSLGFCVLVITSCSTEPPSEPYLHGTWSSPSLGATATAAGLGLFLVCGGKGWFPGPLTLDSFNIFTGAGVVRPGTDTFNVIVAGYVSDGSLNLQWGPPSQPPNINGPTYFLLPDDVARPTNDPCATSANRPD
jgi:hypothetical protein